RIARSNEQVRLLLWSGVAGALGALVAGLLQAAGDRLAPLIWNGQGDLVSLVGSAPASLRLLLPPAGGIVAGLVLVYGVRVTRSASGWGILEAVVLKDGILKFRPALVKSVASLLTIITGGPVGREGPIVLMSATLSSKMGTWLGLSTRSLRLLTAAGVASGIAAAYNAPIGASLFTMEIILGNFAMEVFAPLVFASVVATLVVRTFTGSTAVFLAPPFEMVSAWEIFAYLLLGIFGGLMASAFLGSLRLSSRLFKALSLNRPLSMGVAGLAMGVVVLWHPEICGPGRELTHALLDAPAVWRLAATLLVLKLLMTSLTVGSGAVGGVFTPSLFIGAAGGTAFGTLIHHLAPAATASPSAYALVGMGSLLAGTTHAPIMAVLMIFEMSQNYRIVLPLMLACAAASLVARSLSPKSVYTEALSRKGAQLATPEAQVMTSLSVGEVMRRDYEVVPPDLPLPQVLDRFIAGRRNHLYVADRSGRFLGAIGLHDLKEALREKSDVSFIIALDLMRPSFEVTTPEERLDRVMERLWSQECERIPVVRSNEDNRLVGTISKRDLLGVYSLEVLQRRSLVTRFRAPDLPPEDSVYVEIPPRYRVEGMEAGDWAAGRTVAETGIRERYGITILVVRRRERGQSDLRLVPSAGTRLLRGDRLVLLGPEEGLARLKEAPKPAPRRSGSS
ncbi:MAG: ClcB-like voltage-gated chloride channel protein, partial [Acidobacteriota bacterium]